ncbi:MAG: hypothetical protein K2X01_08070 [Cyanobacteria bacterium]|nr:hypothetical protein [Cyanobacteriota bacterium]
MSIRSIGTFRAAFGSLPSQVHFGALSSNDKSRVFNRLLGTMEHPGKLLSLLEERAKQVEALENPFGFKKRISRSDVEEQAIQQAKKELSMTEERVMDMAAHQWPADVTAQVLFALMDESQMPTYQAPSVLVKTLEKYADAAKSSNSDSGTGAKKKQLVTVSPEVLQQVLAAAGRPSGVEQRQLVPAFAGTPKSKNSHQNKFIHYA